MDHAIAYNVHVVLLSFIQLVSVVMAVMGWIAVGEVNRGMSVFRKYKPDRTSEMLQPKAATLIRMTRIRLLWSCRRPSDPGNGDMDIGCLYVSVLDFVAVTNGKLIISSCLRELLHLAMLMTSTIINYTATARREEKVVGADLAIKIFTPLWVLTLSE
jgi:uncharacterized membrane protein